MNKSILFFMLTIVFMFTSCSKDDNAAEDEVQNQEVSLVGTWRWQSESIDGDAIELNDCEAQFTFEFDANGNFIENQPYLVAGECIDAIDNGTYTINGDTLTLIYSEEGEDYTWEESFVVTSSLLTLSSSDEEGDSIVMFEKM